MPIEPFPDVNGEPVMAVRAPDASMAKADTWLPDQLVTYAYWLLGSMEIISGKFNELPLNGDPDICVSAPVEELIANTDTLLLPEFVT